MTDSLPHKSLVLYADDDLDDIQLVADAFSEFGGTVELMTFSNGADLVAYLRQSGSEAPLPCLIIVDINMPILNGKEALRVIRNMEHTAKLPVVMFSTSTLDSEKAFANAMGAAYVSKPLEDRQVTHIVDQMLLHCGEEIRNRIRKGGKR